MTHEESGDMSFRVSQLEGLVKGVVSKGDLEKGLVGSMKTTYLANLQIHIEERIEENGIKIEE